jgi:hypothetical protein
VNTLISSLCGNSTLSRADLEALVSESVARDIAGGASNAAFRQAINYAQRYGGSASNYVKQVSEEWFTDPSGRVFQLHWVKDLVTGRILDVKAVYQGGP